MFFMNRSAHPLAQRWLNWNETSRGAALLKGTNAACGMPPKKAESTHC